MLKDLNRIETDERRYDYILPKRIVWASEGVNGAEVLYENNYTQTAAGLANTMRFSTEGGKKAAILLDFGTEIYGGIQIVSACGSIRTGSKMHIRLGESVSEAITPLGVKGACCDHGAHDFDIILPWNGCNCFGQTGFRFAYLEFVVPEEFADLYSIQAVAIYHDIPYLGSFRSNDELLNQIYDVSAYTVHLCMQNLLWDGIKRDRLVWIGDTHPEMLAIRTVFGHHKILDDSLRFVAKHTPNAYWPNTMTTYAMWYLMILSDWYMHNGNADLVKELAFYWRAVLTQLFELVHEDGGEVLIEEELDKGYFLDWPTRYHAEAKAGVYGLFTLALDAAARLCSVIGDEEAKALCLRKANVLRSVSFQPGIKKQVTAMLVLAGTISAEKAGPALTKDGGRNMSTFLSYYILQAISQTVNTASALEILREYYGAMLKIGATTFWEDFDLDWMQEGATIEELLPEGTYDIHGDNGRFCYEGFRHSLCHGWSSGPCAFLAEKILGITILEPGCRILKVQPDLGDLTEVTGTYPTPYGVVTVSAKKEGAETVVSVTAPDEIEIVR